MLILAVSSVAPSVHTTAPPAPVAYGCSDPPIGAVMAYFDTCAECEQIGSQGASEGMWTTWHCRAVFPGYYLYAT